MKKSQLKQIIKEEIKNVLTEGFKQKDVKTSLINYIDAYQEDLGEYLDFDDPYTDEFDSFIGELNTLLGKLKSTVKSYNFKSIK